MLFFSFRKFLGYTFLPQILPRINALWQGGFAFVAFSIANVFVATRLLPTEHPYTNLANIGRFGIGHVLAQAAGSLKPSWKTADQTALFLLILVGLSILLMQVFLLAFSFFSQTAFATGLPTGFASYFETAAPEQDIAFMLMDQVFGIPDMFNSCVAQNTSCFPNPSNPTPLSGGVFPYPYHIGLQTMLSFYSYGLLIIGAIILCYYVISIVVDTAQTGTAFGKRFNRVWAPIRLVIALGLLIPVSHGLNAAQYITLQVAKWGSSFATNGWHLVLNNLGNNNTAYGTSSELLSRPQYPTADDIFLFMAVASTCEVAYERMYGQRTGDSEDGDTTDNNQPNVRDRVDIRAWVVRNGIGNTTPRVPLSSLGTMTWEEIQEWTGYGDIIVVFGDYNPAAPTKYSNEMGRVGPLCGEMTLPISRGRRPGAANSPIDTMAYTYFMYFIYAPWVDTGNALNFDDIGTNIANRTLPLGSDPSAPLATPAEMRERFDTYNNLVRPLVDTTYDQMRNEASVWINDSAQYGWAGAPIWYNKIAEVNSDFAEAVFNMPFPSKYPLLMEWVAAQKAQHSVLVSGKEKYLPHLPNGESITVPNDRDKEILKALNKVYGDWSAFLDSMYPPMSGNAFTDTVSVMFQRLGLWSFRANETQHPMANLAVLGRSLVSKSIMFFGLGLSSRATGIFGSSGGMIETMAKKAGGIMTTVAFIGLVVGILLNYVIPFMPFIYFLFAVMAWIKSLFEAMVGVPLWALAHLRYDGHGLPGPKALAGYYMLIDIFLRPILIVFGLMMSSIVFFAMVRTLNNIFILVVSNLSGFDHVNAASATAGGLGSIDYMRGVLDQFFFTILYIIIVYMMGLSCFKMIDQVPANVLRWMGANISSFANRATEHSIGDTVKESVKIGSYQMSDATGGLSQGLFGTDKIVDKAPD